MNRFYHTPAGAALPAPVTPRQPFVRVLKVQFEDELKLEEVPAFRGALLDKMQTCSDLFHNHQEGGGFHYRYPLIQYKALGGRATVLCLGEGIEAMQQFLAQPQLELKLPDRTLQMQIHQLHVQRTTVKVWNHTFHYRLRNWVPLTGNSWAEYRSEKSCIGEIKILERRLRNQLVGAAKAMGLLPEEEIKVTLTSLSEPFTRRFKGFAFLTHNINFTSNFSLPEGIGLGKACAFGFGTLRRLKEN